MTDRYESCAFCSFMRGLAFGAIGGGAAGYLALGMERNHAMIAALFGAVGLVGWVTRKRNK
ncbi:hypothetical protein [Solemya velesiana gill symbiont]|uniref:Uncharacterized protein n=1 Tax=Solemya velesiana gill symbiont TaxID=1918948 RepID=A0A1T2KW62_9GAMM|nr:hypothetical protein [Solemya velesiana gill symbiont]OOZ37098.1 hypothetical protein BOW51_04115 [Solemya velesiana gill symbiont]